MSHTYGHAGHRTGSASGLARIRLSSLGAVAILLIEFILGIVYNLYGTAPTAKKSVGLFSSPVLALHVVVAILLVIAAVGQLVQGHRHPAPADDLDVGGPLGRDPGRPGFAGLGFGGNGAAGASSGACPWRSPCRWRLTSCSSSLCPPRLRLDVVGASTG